MGFITVLGFVAVIFTLLPIWGQTLGAFLLRSSSGWACQVWRLFFISWCITRNNLRAEALQTTGFEILMGNLAWNSENWYTYATRIPERWKPGKVGIAGHSHQPFHLLMVEVPLYTLSSCGLIYIRWRDLNDC